MCKRHRDGYKTRELNSDSMYKKRLLCFEESARLRECEVQCFTRWFFLSFLFSQKSSSRKKEDGGSSSSMKARRTRRSKGPKRQKKGEGVKEHNKRTARRDKKKREKTN